MNLIKERNESLGARARARDEKKGLTAYGGDRIKISGAGVSQIRNLLTMPRKAIHLDGREERASIDPRRRATATILSRVVSRGQWTPSPERENPAGPAIRASRLRFVRWRDYLHLLPSIGK